MGGSLDLIPARSCTPDSLLQYRLNSTEQDLQAPEATGNATYSPVAPLHGIVQQVPLHNMESTRFELGFTAEPTDVILDI